MRLEFRALENGEKVEHPEGSLRWNAQKLLLAGDVKAIREVADRLDGRVAQAITGEDGAPLIPEYTDADRARALAALLAKVKAPKKPK